MSDRYLREGFEGVLRRRRRILRRGRSTLLLPTYLTCEPAWNILNVMSKSNEEKIIDLHNAVLSLADSVLKVIQLCNKHANLTLELGKTVNKLGGELGEMVNKIGGIDRENQTHTIKSK